MNLGDQAIGFLIIASISGAVILLHFFQRLRLRRDEGLLRVVQRYGGSVSAPDGFGPGSAYFRIEGRHATIEYGPEEEPQTRVRVLMPRRSPGVFRILRLGRARRLWGTRDIQVGNARFDRDWYITARPESLVRRIFTEDRFEEVMKSVDRLARFNSPSVEITRDTLVVRVQEWIRGEDPLTSLVSTAAEFVGYLLRLGPEEGIAWVSGENGPGLCPVCAAAMEEAVVHCDKCRTPHHAECWTYVGQCSTYACKGKRCVA
jgi:hypothetical protein